MLEGEVSLRQSWRNQSYVSTSFIVELFIKWAFKLIHYIGRTEVTSWKRGFNDDSVWCFKFAIVFDEFYFNSNNDPTFVLENDTHKLLWDFDIQTDHLIVTRRPDLIIINKKKRTCRIVDLTVPADNRVKLKESEKKDKYLDFARELKKLWNLKVMFISIVIGALTTVTEGLIKASEDLEMRGRLETTRTTALLISARILRRVLETWGDLLSLKLQWKTIIYRWCEKLLRSKQ